MQISKDHSINNKLKLLKQDKKKTEIAISNLVKAIEQGKAVDTLLPQLQKREQELKNINVNIAKESSSLYFLEEKDVIKFLKQFTDGDIDNIYLKQAIFDLLINKVIISDENNGNKKITIICNAHNGSEDISLEQVFNFTKGSSNTHNGGAEGNRTPVQELSHIQASTV